MLKHIKTYLTSSGLRDSQVFYDSLKLWRIRLKAANEKLAFLTPMKPTLFSQFGAVTNV